MREIKEEILSRPISQIIGHYIPLNLRGVNFWGVCPFHSDTKPSMSVNDKKGIYKCFACGAGGNSINFVEKFKKLSFISALKEICPILGLNFTENEASPQLVMTKNILKMAQEIYTSQKSDPIFQNFVSMRGLNEEVVTNFGLGFASSENRLTNFIENIQNNTERENALGLAIELGLIQQNSNDKSYFDSFRNRIIFPIKNKYGDILGFGGRATTDATFAKYFNSRESFYFKKNQLLFGIDLAEQFIKENDKILIVEGYMDVITLHKFGFNYSVAVMGLGLSDHILQYIKKLTTNIYLAFDSDIAGANGALRLNDLFLKAGIIVKYVDFSPFKDPDDFLKNNDRKSLEDKISKAQNFIDLSLEKLILNHIPEIIELKLKLLRHAFQIVSDLGETLEASERLIIFASKIGLRSDPSQIYKSYRDFLTNS